MNKELKEQIDAASKVLAKAGVDIKKPEPYTKITIPYNNFQIPPEQLVEIESLTLTTLARGLAQINRFAGRTEEPCSVAKHSLMLANIVKIRYPNEPKTELYALLHDADEIVIGDIPVLTKRMIKQVPGFVEMEQEIKNKIISYIIEWDASQLFPQEMRSKVKKWDTALGNAEYKKYFIDPSTEIEPSDKLLACEYALENGFALGVHTSNDIAEIFEERVERLLKVIKEA